mmetsp:Transcript_26965/g.86527  ORF Transcript_26965/g.86527 Transcript_26965/m.86527 type:complete len:395 (+) Transcript_26965:137-1321(+)
MLERRLDLVIDNVEDRVDEPHALHPPFGHARKLRGRSGDGEARESVASVVVVAPLARLVAQTALRHLGADDEVVEECRRVVDGAARRELPAGLQQRLDQREGAPLPERVARVHQLVGPALEAPRVRHLPTHQPANQRRQAEPVRGAEQAQRGEAAKGVPAMRLLAGRRAHPALVRLAAEDPVGSVLPRPRRLNLAAQRRHGDRAVRAAHVNFAVVVHREGSVLTPHSTQETAQLGALDELEGGGGADGDEGVNSGVRGRQVRHLPRVRAAAEAAAVRVAAAADEVDDGVGRGGVDPGAEDGEGVDDPVAEPRPTRIERRVSCRQPPEAARAIRAVLARKERSRLPAELRVAYLVDAALASLLRGDLLLRRVARRTAVASVGLDARLPAPLTVNI